MGQDLVSWIFDLRSNGALYFMVSIKVLTFCKLNLTELQSAFSWH